MIKVKVTAKKKVKFTLLQYINPFFLGTDGSRCGQNSRGSRIMVKVKATSNLHSIYHNSVQKLNLPPPKSLINNEF